MAEKIECAVIGAGAVGLAIARELALAGREVVILEAESAIGTHTSSRNSEVIHAGIYYDTGSLKARFCVAGRKALYEYCRSHGVAHKRIGKVIVATGEDQLATLHKYKHQAQINGVDDLRMLSRDELAALEPEVVGVAAFLSPSTGIIDSHGLMLAYLGDAESRGAQLALNSPVTGGRITGDGIILDVGGTAPLQLACNVVVNAAGHGAPIVGRKIAGLPPPTVPDNYFAIGHYYTLSGKAPFNRLVYPIARQDWLGVHVTIDLAGRCRFGPDFEWRDSLDYCFDESREARFYEAIRRYYPALKDGALQPGYTGVRPKITGKGMPAADFVIQDPEVHGVAGMVNLYGIESPGLTSSLAIAAHVRALLAINVEC
jgi:L-2-hydroxyglutarate oxidase LhgO